MDLGEFRSVLAETGLDLWDLIDTAVAVATADHGEELRRRRDAIVEKLYAPPPLEERERGMGRRETVRGSPSTPLSAGGEEGEVEVEAEGGFGVEVDDEQSKILAIKELIEDPDQEDDALVSLLQNLADMDITFKALQETDIGRHVNGLRKHPSGEVRRLVKVLVRKWKDLVDELVKLNSHEATTSAIITDGDSPQQIPARTSHNGNHHVPEFGHSPNPHKGNSSLDRNNWEVEAKPKVVAAPPRREPTSSAKQSIPPPPRAREQQKDNFLDPERLASARKRLHENYQEAQNAKKQRTIQVMDIHDIPKPKNAYFPRNKQVRNR